MTQRIEGVQITTADFKGSRPGIQLAGGPASENSHIDPFEGGAEQGGGNHGGSVGSNHR